MVSFWCYTPVITLQYLLVTVSWNGFPFIDSKKFIVGCFVDGWLVSIHLQFSVLQDQGRFGKERTIVHLLFIYTHVLPKSISLMAFY